MHPEIDNLINMALADGEVTEKERAVILRKAESLGIDKDEVEMILDGKIAMMKKEQASNYSVSKSNKEGDLKKCPSCGAPVESFNTKCAGCGHEFRGTEASKTISSLFEKLESIERERDTIKCSCTCKCHSCGRAYRERSSSLCFAHQKFWFFRKY